MGHYLISHIGSGGVPFPYEPSSSGISSHELASLPRTKFSPYIYSMLTYTHLANFNFDLYIFVDLLYMDKFCYTLLETSLAQPHSWEPSSFDPTKYSFEASLVRF